MMKDKKNTSKVLIIILILVIITLLGYIIYDKGIRKEEIKEENKQEETTIRKINKQEEKILLNQITAYTTYLADSYPITENKPLENQEALYFAYQNLENKDIQFSENDLEKVLEKYFGKNHPYIHENINCFVGDGPLYEYDSTQKIYIYQDIHGHGGKPCYQPSVYLVDGKVTSNKKYKIKTHILYANGTGDTLAPSERYYTSIHKDYDDYVLGPYDQEHQVTEEEYQSIKDQIPITTFTFEKDEDNNYGLKSVTIA